MLPIAEHFTPELLDKFDADFVEQLIEATRTMEAPEAEKVFKAIARSTSFKSTMNAAIASVENMGSWQKGAPHLVVICLMAGWKLAERRMSELAEGVAG